ncbi:hypothetical protein M2266_004731 [Streptomyces sp. SPB162]|nr:hypothetical protein [Streptomyces sp. SPB162]
MRWDVRTEYVKASADEVSGHAVEYVTDSTSEHGWEWLRRVCREA